MKVKVISKRIIWSNEDYAEWLEHQAIEGLTDLSEEDYYEDCLIALNDERENLYGEVDGVIVCFGDMGRWNGRCRGAKIDGEHVNNILYSECDHVTWYCDRYNVRCDATHHDGVNHYLYRVCKDREEAQRLIGHWVYDGWSEGQIRKATKSLRPYVAKVYGW